MPMAHTPMDKKSGQAQNRAMKKMHRQLDKLTPWKRSSRRQELEKYVKPGEVAVLLDAGEDANHPLFEGTKVIHKR